MTAPQSSPPTREEPTSISGVVDLVTAYAKQETLGPLQGRRPVAGAGRRRRGLPRPRACRCSRSAILRLVQTEWDRSAEGSLSWLPYLIAFLFCVACLAVTISRINKDSLNKEPQ